MRWYILMHSVNFHAALLVLLGIAIAFIILLMWAIVVNIPFDFSALAT